MGARAGANAKLRMKGSFIRMASCYAPTARLASYASPTAFPGGTVARSTSAQGTWEATPREELLCFQPISLGSFRKTCWCINGAKRRRGNILLQQALRPTCAHGQQQRH